MEYMYNNFILFITLDSAVYLWSRSISVCRHVTAQVSRLYFSNCILVCIMSVVWYGHFRED